MPIFEKNTSRITSLYPTERQKTCANNAAADVLLQKHGLHNQKCSGEKCSENATDDFVKQEKMLIFFDKNRLRISPLDPTERYKHVQTMIQVVFYQKNTGSTTKNALGVGIAKKNHKLGQNGLFVCPASHPYTLQIPKNACKYLQK